MVLMARVQVSLFKSDVNKMPGILTQKKQNSVCALTYMYTHTYTWASQTVLVVKNLPSNVGDIRDMGLIPGLGRCPGGGHGNPLQYLCLENSMERGAW